MSKKMGSSYAIHSGNDDRCGYCGEIITKDETQITYLVYPPYKFWHLFSSGQCEGWIHRNWEFIKDLLHRLTDIGGDDYDEFMDMLIKLWEEGS